MNPELSGKNLTFSTTTVEIIRGRLNERLMVVLTRGKSGYPDTEAGRQLDEDRKRMQSDLLNLSRGSKQILAAASGHHIRLDDPALVIDAIRRVVAAARRDGKRGRSR